MVVQLLQVDEGDLGGLLNLTHNLLSKVVEVLLSVHELLQINHRVQISHYEKLVLTASHIHVHLVHRDVLSVAAISVLLHLRVVVEHLIGWDVEGERSALLNMV